MKKGSNNTEIQRFNPNIDNGLSTEQVNDRLNNKLYNYTKKKYSKSIFSIFADNIFTFFNFLGFIVAFALVVVKAPLFDFVFVLVFIANLSIGIIQEIRAKLCIDKLTLISSKSTQVLRNGKTDKIPSCDLVLDDIVILGLGSQVPTDCIIKDGEVEVNESLLTGESIPVKKTVGDLLYAGSFIISGTCKAQAEHVGKANYVETLSEKAKKYKKPHSELMESLKLLIKIIGFIIVPMGALTLIKSTLILNTDFNESVKTTSTVIIGMIPSGMFLLTSLALAIGIIKLARHNTLVQDLYSLEMLARVDTICFDKTGTITDGRMSVNELVPLTDNKDYDFNKIISSMLGTLNDNNQTAIALYNKFGQKKYYTSLSTIPFNSIRKLSAVSFENMGTFTFGAPEFVLNKNDYLSIKSVIDQYSSMGLRVLLLGHSKDYIENDNIPNNFIPISLITIVDNIREDAISTIKWFKQNDVEIKVISGDNPITVAEVSKRVGISNADKYISLEGLSDNEIFEIANKYTVFGRVSPEQKAVLIKAIKSAGHTTAMTGDGINDILALKEADCAISVASGSESARNLAHIVLMDNNFASMPKVVQEGRRVINNVSRASSLYLMKTFFTMFLSLLTLLLPYMKTYPFSLRQMNILEIFVIGLPSFFLSLQPNDERVKGSFMSAVLSNSAPGAILMVISVLIVEIFQKSLNYFPIDVYRTIQVFSLTFAGLINLCYICRPFNTYRSVLFFISLTVIVFIFLFTIINGLSMLSLTKLSPITDYWHHLLILISVLLFDLNIIGQLQKMCRNLKVPKHKHNK